MQVQRKHTLHVFGVLSTTLVILSFCSTAGLFAYKYYLNTQLTAERGNLNALNDTTTERKLSEIQTYDHKLTIARSLLDNHIAVSRIFNVLEDSTKQTIRLISFEYTYDPGFEAEIKLGGDTKELKSVALQKLQVINDSIFSDFIVQEVSLSGGVDEGAQNGKTDQAQETDTSQSLGVTFEILGLFKKDLIEFKGNEREIDIYSISTYSAEPTGGINQQNIAVTPTTTTSSNTTGL